VKDREPRTRMRKMLTTHRFLASVLMLSLIGHPIGANAASALNAFGFARAAPRSIFISQAMALPSDASVRPPLKLKAAKLMESVATTGIYRRIDDRHRPGDRPNEADLLIGKAKEAMENSRCGIANRLLWDALALFRDAEEEHYGLLDFPERLYLLDDAVNIMKKIIERLDHNFPLALLEPMRQMIQNLIRQHGVSLDHTLLRQKLREIWPAGLWREIAVSELPFESMRAMILRADAMLLARFIQEGHSKRLNWALSWDRGRQVFQYLHPLNGQDRDFQSLEELPIEEKYIEALEMGLRRFADAYALARAGSNSRRAV
jgi:hypothetical protein